MENVNLEDLSNWSSIGFEKLKDVTVKALTSPQNL